MIGAAEDTDRPRSLPVPDELNIDAVAPLGRLQIRESDAVVRNRLPVDGTLEVRNIDAGGRRACGCHHAAITGLDPSHLNTPRMRFYRWKCTLDSISAKTAAQSQQSSLDVRRGR